MEGGGGYRLRRGTVWLKVCGMYSLLFMNTPEYSIPVVRERGRKGKRHLQTIG
jgi:hypothetical protein